LAAQKRNYRLIIPGILDKKLPAHMLFGHVEVNQRLPLRATFFSLLITKRM